MDYLEMLNIARDKVGPLCKACPVCNGKACGNSMPGPGSKNPGNGALKNYEAWQNICVNMDTIADNCEPCTEFELYGQKFSMPLFSAPIGAMPIHYGSSYNDISYNKLMIETCKEFGIASFTGEGVDSEVMKSAVTVMDKCDGIGVPTIKPRSIDVISEKINFLNERNIFALAMDIDAAGLPHLKAVDPNAGSKTVSELKEVIGLTDRPFIIKGIMTVKGALKAVQAGAKGIVVSNHGGRVLGQTPSTAEVLPEIADAVKGKTTIFVDGGIRNGVDIFKALALGADAVLIGRPFVPAVYGAAKEGILLLLNKYMAELKDTMKMCGACKLSDITRDMVRF